MVTREAFPDIIHKHLPQEEIINALEGVGDHIVLEVNGYGYCCIHSTEYDYGEEQEVLDAGDLYVDKDQFCILLKEINFKFI